MAPTKRSARATKARQLAWSLCKQDGMATNEIARIFGRNRQTVYHGINKAKEDWGRKYTDRDPVVLKSMTRNGRILELYALGFTYAQIAHETGTTRGIVAGVIHRNRWTDPDPIKVASRKKGN
jgi:DNA invertase Pin-like site-specific DNA recombinase